MPCSGDLAVTLRRHLFHLRWNGGGPVLAPVGPAPGSCCPEIRGSFRGPDHARLAAGSIHRMGFLTLRPPLIPRLGPLPRAGRASRSERRGCPEPLSQEAWCLATGILEKHSGLCELVDVGGLRFFEAIATEVIGAGGVERDEKDIRSRFALALRSTAGTVPQDIQGENEVYPTAHRGIICRV